MKRALLAATAVVMLCTPTTTASQTITDVEVPGWPLSRTTTRDADGGETLWLLVTAPTDDDPPPWRRRGGGREVSISIGDSSGVSVETSNGTESGGSWRPESPPTLYRFDTENSRFVEVQSELPVDVLGLDAADLDGDGNEEVVLAEPGKLSRLDSEDRIQPLIEEQTIDPKGALFRNAHFLHSDGSGRIWIETIGALVGYGPEPEGDSWREVARIPTETRAAMGGNHLLVWSPRLYRFTSHPGPPSPVLVSDPEDLGHERLHTRLYHLDAEGEDAVSEHWSRFGGKERVVEVRALNLDGDPLLAVWTERADKLVIFAKARLSVFSLGVDRTRSGQKPLLFLENAGGDAWDRPKIQVADADRDGRQDLLLVHPKKKRLRVDAYLRRGTGDFVSSPAKTLLDLEDAEDDFERVFAEDDLDGDGLVDLFVLTDDEALIYCGSGDARRGARLFESDPSRSVVIAKPVRPDPDEDGDRRAASRRLWRQRLDRGSEQTPLLVVLEWHEKAQSMVLRVSDVDR